MYIQAFRPPVLKTPPKSSPPSDGGRMDRGCKWPSRRIVTFQRWEVAGAVFFWLKSWKQRKKNWIQFRKRWWVLSVEILLDFGVSKNEEKKDPAQLLAFPPGLSRYLHTLLLIDNKHVSAEAVNTIPVNHLKYLTGVCLPSLPNAFVCFTNASFCWPPNWMIIKRWLYKWLSKGISSISHPIHCLHLFSGESPKQPGYLPQTPYKNVGFGESCQHFH